MEDYFWTGFYLLVDGELMVHAYQGPVACMHLKKGTGVCWAGVTRQELVIVPDVEAFPGHIACDARSQSEIVVPLRDAGGNITGVLDIDSSEKNSFDEVDARWLKNSKTDHARSGYLFFLINCFIGQLFVVCTGNGFCPEE
ncbi:MAG: GAF domain-containing protein [Bacteroidales bacterium]|nr:GAF domain-containing protein [Bacteroidales bacterium]